MRIVKWLGPVLGLLAACAGPVAGPRLGGGRPLFAAAGSVGWDDAPVERAEPEGPELGEVTEKQRESESQRASEEMWRVLAPVEAVGAEVELVYWAQRGALTLVSWRKVAEGGARGGSVDGEGFTRKQRAWLSTFIGEGARWVRIVHRREQRGWVMKLLRAEPGEAPPEAKTLPVDAPGLPSGAFAVLEREARRRWLPLLRAPEEGTASVELRVELEDERLLGSSVTRLATAGRGAAVGAAPGFETQVAGALVGFAQGLGKRSVRVVLEASRGSEDGPPRWRVARAETIRQPGVEKAEWFTTSTEYRLLHEEVMRRWRQETRDAAVFAAAFTAEQVALWAAGEWLAKGVGTALELAAGPVARVLGRGGAGAAEWLFCLLKRLPESEREAIARLLTKVETEGFEALTVVERNEFRATVQKLDRLAVTKLTEGESEEFRKIAGKRFWRALKQTQPSLARMLVDANGDFYPVHHKFPLEYAHLDPLRDINGLENLVAVQTNVHRSIGAIWSRLRRVSQKVTVADVQQVMSIVDRHYGRWYNAVETNTLQVTYLEAAKRSALSDVEMLMAEIRSR